MQIEFDEHPARTTIPAAEGYAASTVPMFPDHKLIRVNGIGIAYLSLTSGNLNFIWRQPDAVRAAVQQRVEEEFPNLGKVTALQPPELPEGITDDD